MIAPQSTIIKPEKNQKKKKKKLKIEIDDIVRN